MQRKGEPKRLRFALLKATVAAILGYRGPVMRDSGEEDLSEISFNLTSAGLYRVRVCGFSVTGLSACAESDGLYYDVTPPVPGRLCVVAGSLPAGISGVDEEFEIVALFP